MRPVRDEASSELIALNVGLSDGVDAQQRLRSPQSASRSTAEAALGTSSTFGFRGRVPRITAMMTAVSGRYSLNGFACVKIYSQFEQSLVL